MSCFYHRARKNRHLRAGSRGVVVSNQPLPSNVIISVIANVTARNITVIANMFFTSFFALRILHCNIALIPYLAIALDRYKCGAK